MSLPLRTARIAWRIRLCVLAATAGVLAAPAPAAAWNATGHVLIALLAYDALAPTQRAALVRLLQAHPRLSQDLMPALPLSLPSGARDRWLFALAATWPDLARGQPTYDHGTWHYVNLPLSLRRGELSSCQQARRDFPESVRRLAQVDAARRAQGLPGIPGGDSIREALPNNARTLADENAPPSERALSLSWVLHLVADAHQPLHAVALFTPGRFATGDRGGNDIVVPERGPLHRVWDELLGVELAPDAVEVSVRQLTRPSSAVRAEPAPIELAAWLDRWLDEDCELARDAVYPRPVLRVVEQFEAGSVKPAAGAPTAPAKPEIVASPEYLRRASERARERARLAASRLATLLSRMRF